MSRNDNGSAPSNDTKSQASATNETIITPMGVGVGNLPTASPAPSAPSQISAMVDRDYEPLTWSGPFKFPGMIRIRTLADGSCFFHAIANAFFKPYRTGMIESKAVSKSQLIRGLRQDLSIKLGEPVDPLEPSGPTHYDLLGRGQLKEFAKEHPQYTLANMKKELDSDSAVDNVYNEFISNQLGKDIYLLDRLREDVYPTGDDAALLYRNRSSVVLLVTPGHYELIGLEKDGTITTIFHADHPFIRAIRQRLIDIKDRRTPAVPKVIV